MKLSELKPCFKCGGPLVKPPAGNWFVVRISSAMIDPFAARQVGGLAMIFGGALGLAETMAPAPEKAVLILGDEQPALMAEFHLCMDCVPVELFGMWEQASPEKDDAGVPA